MIRASSSTVDWSCGLGVIGSFYNGYREYSSTIFECVRELKENDGTGFFVVGFIDNLDCRQAYEELRERAKLIYQSPVRVNRNSDNEFFFCVFDATTKE